MINFILGISASICAALIIGFFLKFKAGWRKWPGFYNIWRLNRDLISAGLINFFSCRKVYNIHKDHGKASDYICKAKKELHYIGFWLASSTEEGNIIITLKDLIEKKIKVTIVLMDPNCDSIKHFAEYSNMSHKEIKTRINKAIEKICEMFFNLSEEKKEYFDLRLHKISLNNSAFLIDVEEDYGKILIDFKLFGLSRDESFGMEVQNYGSTLFSRLLNSNKSIIKRSFSLIK